MLTLFVILWVIWSLGQVPFYAYKFYALKLWDFIMSFESQHWHER